VAVLTSEPEVLRVDGPAKVSGAARYAGDVRLPGLLVGMALRSPLPHARIVRIDPSAARQVPEVHAVLTAADLPDVLIGKALRDMPVLARDRVRYVGEKVAVVAAETREAAEAALAAIEVEYAELPAISSIDEAIRPDAPPIHPGRERYQRGHEYPEFSPDEPNVNSLIVLAKGDVDAGFAQATHVFEDEFRVPMQHVGFLEPHVCTVAIEPDEKVRVWTCIKIPFSVPAYLSQATGVPAEQFVVMPTPIGGDFGGKGFLMDEAVAYFLARASGRPVRMVTSMNEEFQAGIPRHAALIRIKSGLDAEGRLVARDCTLYWASGAYAGYRAGPGMTGARRAPGGYAIPHIRVTSRLVWTNHMPCGSMRAPGQPQVTFACESHMDLIAQRLGLDPLDLRRRNVAHAGEVMVDGEPIQGETARLVLDRAAACMDWSAPLPPGHGRGVAFSERGTGAGRAAVEVSVDSAGQVLARTGVPEQGGGAHTVIQQVVARTLGIPAGLVRVEQGDTDSGPFDQGVGGSRVTNSTGGAAQRATEQLRERLCLLAAEERGWREGSVRLEGGAFVSEDEREEFARLAGQLARREGGAIREESDYRAARGPSGFACHAVEVSVDRDTGQVRLEKLLAVHDVGYAINPVGLMGQIHGGLLQSLGQTFMEELPVVDGQPRAINLGEYKIPCSADIPDLRVELIQEHDGPGPFGAKGVGEISALPAAAAVANAVDNAVGVRLLQLPITAERVRAGLRRADQGNGH
jgi:CO/xanthine dehydrogenase Mo-binding subunit